MSLNFNGSMNVICGTNGIGKTTIIDIILDSFAYEQYSRLIRNSLADFGSYKLLIEDNGKRCLIEEKIINFASIEKKQKI